MTEYALIILFVIASLGWVVWFRVLASLGWAVWCRIRDRKLAAENKTLRDALEGTLYALEAEGPTFWSYQQDAARAALTRSKS